MPTIGYLLSSNFVKYINAYSHWVAFVLLLVIGANMIRESVVTEEEQCGPVVGIKELFGLAIATSIDALAVGITFGTMGDKLQLPIWSAVILIGITTFIISVVGVFIGNVFGSKYKTKAEIVGGVILIIIGIKVVLEHYL